MRHRRRCQACLICTLSPSKQSSLKGPNLSQETHYSLEKLIQSLGKTLLHSGMLYPINHYNLKVLPLKKFHEENLCLNMSICEDKHVQVIVSTKLNLTECT